LSILLPLSFKIADKPLPRTLFLYAFAKLV
jgi:hypothetical protein